MAKKKSTEKPWDFLKEYRDTHFTGEWPTVVQMLDITVERYPENTAFVVFSPEKVSLTYQELQERVNTLADYLVSLGISEGDKIAVSGKNSPEWGIAYLATLYAGAIVVPLDATLSNEDMSKLMAFAEVKMFFADRSRLDGFDPENTLGLEQRFSLEPESEHPFIMDLATDAVVERHVAKAEDTAAILFTSGTTGTPKGVVLSHQNLVSDCYLAQANMTIYSTDVFYAILPLHHSYSMMAVFIESLSVGASIVFGKRLIISQVFKEMREGEVTMFLAVPMLFNKMIAALMDGVRQKGIIVYGAIRALMSISGLIKKVFKVNVGKKMFGFLLRNLSMENNRICISGGGPLPSSTFKLFNQLGIDFVQGYGLTETSPITHLNPTDAYKEESVGKRVAQVEVKIVEPDSDGNGLIYIKGPMVMQGYYKNEEATAEVLHDGWLNTGDVGYQDSEGYLYLTGRAKNLIVTEGGKNVFPEEIEDLFQLYSEIDTICVLGYILDQRTKSEGIRALVYPDQSYRDTMVKEHGESADSEIEARINAIISEVNRKLQAYKKITRVTVVDEPLPMTSTKKVQRHIVAQKYKD
ncbi:MAG TPA: AMP-binding protein [Sphaerochaeta sp.]|nr:AMP-binding protein [Sphaerochaeta sp.]